MFKKTSIHRIFFMFSSQIDLPIVFLFFSFWLKKSNNGRHFYWLFFADCIESLFFMFVINKKNKKNSNFMHKKTLFFHYFCFFFCLILGLRVPFFSLMLTVEKNCLFFAQQFSSKLLLNGDFRQFNRSFFSQKFKNFFSSPLYFFFSTKTAMGRRFLKYGPSPPFT